MTKFYRFRSIKKFLAPCFHELERQTAFFASLDDLNDPMEGFRDLVWSGDHIEVQKYRTRARNPSGGALRQYVPRRPGAFPRSSG